MITNTKHLGQSATYALLASATIVSLLFMSYFLVEPAISHGQTSQTFSIQQTITDESSITVAGDVTMVGDINGVTGGNATGSTQFTVTTNNTAGYSVTIGFYDNGTDQTMIGDVTGSESIRDYDGDEAGPEPSYGFTASSAALFGYTVMSTTSTDTDQSFLDLASSCNQSGGSQTGSCWKEPTVGAYTIVSRSGPAITGATSTVQFKVNVPAGATPVPVAETYTATATLSLIIN